MAVLCEREFESSVTWPFVCLFVRFPVFLSDCQSVCLPFYLSVCLSISLFILPFVFAYKKIVVPMHVNFSSFFSNCSVSGHVI